MTFTKPFGALVLVLTVAFNAGAGEPAVVAPDQTSAQAIDRWYANNQSDAELWILDGIVHGGAIRMPEEGCERSKVGKP